MADDGGPDGLDQSELDGDELPPFASEQNKELDREVKALNGEIDKVQFQADENSDRIKVMVRGEIIL